MLLFRLYFLINNNYTIESSYVISHSYIVFIDYGLSTISDNFDQKCHVAITIIYKLKVTISYNNTDKNLSIDNYRR